MGIRVRLAETTKELDDVFWVRRQVYSVEEGKFAGDQVGGDYLVDRFDAHPSCAKLIAYDGDEPIATIRVNLDTGSGLPAESLYDFSDVKARIIHEWHAKRGEMPRLGSAGMLAVRRPWRRRRDVVRSLFKLAATVGRAWGGTHVLVAVNHENEEMYRRLGFSPVDDKRWVDSIGDHVVPMVSTFGDIYTHTVGARLDDIDLLNCFPNPFRRIVYRAGESVFNEFDEADECYIIDVGSVKITSTHAGDGRELVFAVLGPGEMFGEMALIDAKTRSANAIAASDTELIVLRREDFLQSLHERPERLDKVLNFFAARLRRADEFAKLLAYGTAEQRIEFALTGLLESGRLKSRSDGTTLLRAGPTELAAAAGANLADVRGFLDRLRRRGICDYSDTRIEFLRPYHRSAPVAERPRGKVGG